MIIRLYLSALFSLMTLQLSASLDSCYQVVEVVNGSEFLVDDILSFDFDNPTLEVNEILFAISEISTYQTGHKEALVHHFDCLYPFDYFEERGIFSASVLDVNFGDNSLEQMIIATHHQSDLAYVIIGAEVYLAIPCTKTNECIGPRYRQPVIANVDYTLGAVPQGVDIEISPVIRELVTEQVLVQDAYSIVTVVDHEYELITEQRPLLYVNLCPDFEAIPLEVEEEVLVREASSQLTVISAEFELVTEEVLENDAYLDVEIVTVSNWDQPYQLEILPEYFSYDWIGQPSCLSQNPYDCVEVFTTQYPKQIQVVDNPSEWNCGEAIDYSESMLLESDVHATYSRRSYFKLKWPATTMSTDIPAQTKTRKYTTFENLNTIPDTCIQITYETDTLYRLTKPVTTQSQEVPAIYQTRTYLKTVQDGSFELNSTQAICEFNFQGQRLISPAMTTYDPYLCEITDVERQEAIKLSLNQGGALDDLSFAYGSGEFWISLFDFQSYRDNWDIGPLNEAQAEFLDRP